MNSKSERNGVVVYCASSSDIDPKYMLVARTTGGLIADSGFSLVCGGGAAGMMAAAIEGSVQAGGKAVGVLPEFMMHKRWNHPQLSQCIVTDSMHSRKMTMASMSCAAIALPGGIGTLDELAEIMTWHQLGLFTGPVIIVNTDGYYDPLLDMFRRMADLGFMRDGQIPATVVATPEEALAIVRNHTASCGK
ncbi:MAG: TIGR00730 family Rossman fold protein [Duncaniella sp.]|nr:TIGR00730 family Rossman fold protein [Duncaniella sp.]